MEFNMGLEKGKILENIKKCIRYKYNIDVSYNNGNMQIYNASEEIFKYFKNLEKPYKKILDFENKLSQLIMNEKYAEASKEIENSLNDNALSDLGIYYTGKVFESQKNI